MVCLDAVPYTESVALKSIVLVQSLVCFLSVATSSLCIRIYLNGFYHPNYTILLKIYLLVFIFHGSILGVMLGYHFTLYQFFAPCDIYVSTWVCFLYRHTTNSAVAMMSFIEFSLTIERTIALLYKKNYASFGSRIGKCLGFASIFVGEALTFYLMHFSFPLKGSQKFCTGATFYADLPNGIDTMNIFLYTTLSLDVFSALLLMLLNVICKRILKTNNYNLSTRFEDQRNKDVLSGLIPTMLFHSIFGVVTWSGNLYLYNFLDHAFSEVQFTTIAATTKAVPLYTFFAPLLMMYMRKLRKGRVTKVEQVKGDDYFKTYTTLWK